MKDKIKQYDQYGTELEEFINKVDNDKVLDIQERARFINFLYKAQLYCIGRISVLDGSYKKDKNKLTED